MPKIYLDYASTTPVDPQVQKAMEPFLVEEFGNPSSQHSFGLQAAKGLDKAREQVAKFFDCEFSEVIFTSGATEANNLAILGLVKKFVLKKTGITPHVITTSIEHSSVLKTFQHIEEMGLADVTYLAPNSDGLVSPEQVGEALQENTILVSIMYANNEIGTIQPITKIGKVIRKYNDEKTTPKGPLRGKPENDKTKVYFHTDAVQAANYLEMRAEYLVCDMITISGHKIYGPKGVGALYVRQGTPLTNIMYGGSQELSLRPGTHNVPAIVGFGEAVSILTPEFREKEAKRVKELLHHLTSNIKHLDIKINGSIELRLPNNLNISIPGQNGEMLSHKLDQEGISVSTGSACAAGATEPSHVLLALGYDRKRVNSSIRISLGRQTTKTDLDHVGRVLSAIFQRG